MYLLPLLQLGQILVLLIILMLKCLIFQNFGDLCGSVYNPIPNPTLSIPTVNWSFFPKSDFSEPHHQPHPNSSLTDTTHLTYLPLTECSQVTKE